MHRGKKVSPKDARFVIDTVYKWLAYLGSTIEIELALIALKRYIEGAKISFEREADVIPVILEYFGRTKAASGSAQVTLPVGSHGQARADLVLRFGSHTVLIETKFSRSRSTKSIVESAVQQASRLMDVSGITQSAVIIFQKGSIEPGFENVQKYLDGKVYVVVIKA